MKKFIIILSLLLVSSVMFAKQKVEYFRYGLAFNVASAAKNDLDDLIDRGYKIISFSLDYNQRCMIVVYE